jgi:transposase-like protein
MRQQTRPSKEPAEKVVQDIRRATRKHYSAEEKIRIVLEGLRGEDSIAELCRTRGSSRTFITAGRKTFSRGEEATGWRYDPGRDVGRGVRQSSDIASPCQIP